MPYIYIYWLLQLLGTATNEVEEYTLGRWYASILSSISMSVADLKMCIRTIIRGNDIAIVSSHVDCSLING